jgi:choline dehydrogenase-like flavoprotein
MTGRDCNYLVVGSGFGWAVSAFRLLEKGYRVIVLGQGRRIGPRADRGRPERLSESVAAGASSQRHRCSATRGNHAAAVR